VRALEFMPADRRLIRAATFSVEGTGQWLGSWTPWHTSITLPEGVVYRLAAGSRIAVDLFSRGPSESAVTRGTLGVFFAKSASRMHATDLVLDARTVTGSRALKGSGRVMADARVWAIQPELLPGMSSLEVSARRPDGGTDVLLALTEPSVDWPTPYLLETPHLLARGTELFVVARFPARQPRQMRVRVSRY